MNRRRANWVEETMAALDSLVRAGKVRYIGVSDTPAWKIAQANMLAQFRGWSAFIGLQIEYSLLQRTVEQELVPLALEFGLGITPWSPLKSGALSGKYTRNNAGSTAKDRGPFLEPFLNETTFALLDELAVIAKAHGSTVARAWVLGRPGVGSTIIGSRRIEQLEENLGALGLDLAPGETARLDALTAPTFGFPQNMQPIFPAIHNGGTTVNGVHAPASSFGLVHGRNALLTGPSAGPLPDDPNIKRPGGPSTKNNPGEQASLGVLLESTSDFEVTNCDLKIGTKFPDIEVTKNRQ